MENQKTKNDIDESKKKSLKQRIFSNEFAGAVWLSKIGDVLILHFAFLLSSIFIVTIGAALTAANYTGMKMANGMDGGVLENYFKAFKSNFKRSTIYFLLMVCSGFVIYMSFGYWFSMRNVIAPIMAIVSIVLAIIWMMIFLYLFGVQAKFENTFANTLKNSLKMAVANLPFTLIMFCIIAGMIYLFVMVRLMSAVFVVAGFGILFLAFGKLYNLIFAKYIVEC